MPLPKLESTLDAYYLHERLLHGLLPPEQVRRVEQSIEHISPDDPFRLTRINRAFIDELVALSQEREIPLLDVALLRNDAHAGQAVIVEQDMYFKGMVAAYDRFRNGNVTARAEMHGKLSTNRQQGFIGQLSPEHLRNNTALERLSGRQTLYCLAIIDQIANPIVLRPVVIATRHERFSGFPAPLYKRHEIHPSQIDEFARLADLAATEWDTNALQAIPEAQIKQYLAGLLDEPFTQKDWGGEASDLFTSRLHVEGEPVSAAFLLKGPSIRGSMTIAALGKNGDQISRLYNEPADLLVLQHCNHIRADVVNVMRAFAVNMYNPRRYCVIDGPDTWRILKAYGLI